MNTYFSVKLMKAMFTVHTYLFTLPLSEPSMCHGSQCALMARETREPSNCELQQSLCQWKQWITDIQPGTSRGSALHVSPMCHVTWLLPWWGSMFRKCVKSHRRHPAIPQSYPCPWIYFEIFLCHNIVIGFLSGSLVVRRRLESHLGKAKRKWSITL